MIFHAAYFDIPHNIIVFLSLRYFKFKVIQTSAYGIQQKPFIVFNTTTFGIPHSRKWQTLIAFHTVAYGIPHSRFCYSTQLVMVFHSAGYGIPLSWVWYSSQLVMVFQTATNAAVK